MKNWNMEIRYLDFLYAINGYLHRDRKEILSSDFQSKISGELPAIDDVNKLEMYEIMRQPVILPVKKMTPKRTVMRLKILCCFCFEECLFLYLFTGEEWKFHDANFNNPN